MFAKSACSMNAHNSGRAPSRRVIAEANTSLRTRPGWRIAICRPMLAPLLKPKTSTRSNARCRAKAATSSADDSNELGWSGSDVRP